MKRLAYWIILLPLFALAPDAWAQGWNSDLLSVDESGVLHYHADTDGYVLPDFSHAGYKGGGVALPEVPVVMRVNPIAGDNTSQLQAAIDSLAAMEPDANGLRGALLLGEGVYELSGSLTVEADGIVLRGADRDQTILRAVGDTPHQRTVILLGNASKQVNGLKQLKDSKSDIIDDVVPVGSLVVTVTDGSLYEVGDRVVVYHPCTEAWLEAVNYGGVPYPDPSNPDDADERWSVNQLPICYNRYVVAIDGNILTLDAPIFYTLRRSLSQSYVYRPDMSGLVRQVGLESLTIEIESEGGEDETHAWHAAKFRSCEDAWAVDCLFRGFGQSGIITEACSRSTFRQCDAVDPVAIVTGERMYNFNTYLYSQLNLFENCYARGGRHHFVSNGTSTTSGNVFLRCTSDAINSASEGHRQWTQGMLYDNLRELNLKRAFVLGLYNRVAMGTGHGWAAVQSVLWNCDVDKTAGTIGLQQPPTAQNYAIGCQAKSITGTPVKASCFELGYVEGQNESGLEPASLYEAQLEARLRGESSGVATVEEKRVDAFSDGKRIHVRLANSDASHRMQLFSAAGMAVASSCPAVGEREVVWDALTPGLYLIVCNGRVPAVAKCIVY